MNILRNIIWKNKNNIFAKLKAGGNYSFKEIEAPKGCQLAEPVEYTVKDTGEVQKVSVTDKKTPTPRVPQTGETTPLVAVVILLSMLGCAGVFLMEFVVDWKAGERQPTAETTLRHNLIKNDKRKTAKAL